MKLEQMKKIVDGAPSWATHFDRSEKQYYSEDEPFIDGLDLRISDLRAELAKHDTLDLEPSDIPHGCVILEK